MAGCLDDVFFKTDNINAWKTILRPFSLLWQGLKVSFQCLVLSASEKSIFQQ